MECRITDQHVHNPEDGPTLAQEKERLEELRCDDEPLPEIIYQPITLEQTIKMHDQMLNEMAKVIIELKSGLTKLEKESRYGDWIMNILSISLFVNIFMHYFY